MYPVIASDLDGTLLSDKHVISDFTAETLTLLIAKGVKFIFATGRHHLDVAKIRDQLSIEAYMITSNGCRVHDMTGKLVAEHNLPEHVAQQLFAIRYHDPQVLTHVYQNDNWFMSRNDINLAGFYPASGFHYQLFKPEQLSGQGISKVFFTSDRHEVLEALEKQLLDHYGDSLNLSFSLPLCLEVMPEGVSKGQALQQVAAALGYTLADCLAFGDGMNDKEMLMMAGKGCVMANAHARLMLALPELQVIDANDKDGVAHYLRQLYQIE